MDYVLMTLHSMENYLSLQYKVEYPLNLVLTENCLKKYNRMFFTILKVKKILLLLTGCWKQLNSVEFQRIED